MNCNLRDRLQSVGFPLRWHQGRVKGAVIGCHTSSQVLCSGATACGAEASDLDGRSAQALVITSVSSHILRRSLSSNDLPTLAGSM